jgi:hypothetical protein
MESRCSISGLSIFVRRLPTTLPSANLQELQDYHGINGSAGFTDLEATESPTLVVLAAGRDVYLKDCKLFLQSN